MVTMARRLSLEPCPTGLKKWPWRVNLPGNITGTGKRQRRFFESKQAAETFCRVERIRLDNYGRNSTTLTPGQQEEAAMVFERLSPYNVTLNTVVADFIARYEARTRSITYKALVEAFIVSKRNRSKAYLRALKYTLANFQTLHDRKVCDIEPGEIEKEMQGRTPAVRNAYLRNLRAIFNFGIKRAWLESNPIAKLDFEVVRNGEVVTLTPKQALALMFAAADLDNELLPYHALGLFAGIRPFELQRLQWDHIDLLERHIEITSAVSKTGRRRIIEMEPNLAAWLNQYIAKGGKTTGGVTPSSNLRNRLREIRNAAGLTKWEQDVMRHSYASYWLAEHSDINRLTLQMGHESADMLWKHYHKASKRKDAETYWKITPRDVGEKIVPIAIKGARA
jgi:integrase